MKVPDIKVGQVVEINFETTLSDGKKEKGLFSGRVLSVLKQGGGYSRFNFEGTAFSLITQGSEVFFLGNKKATVKDITLIK